MKFKNKHEKRAFLGGYGLRKITVTVERLKKNWIKFKKPYWLQLHWFKALFLIDTCDECGVKLWKWNEFADYGFCKKHVPMF